MKLTTWKRPARDSEIHQSMHDALLNLPKGDGLVYFEGRHLPERSGVAASARNLQKFGSLVQKASGPADRFASTSRRTFQYILQRK